MDGVLATHMSVSPRGCFVESRSLCPVSHKQFYNWFGDEDADKSDVPNWNQLPAIRSLELTTGTLQKTLSGAAFPLLSSSLVVLHFSNCPALRRLPESICTLQVLTELAFINCPSLERLPGFAGLSSLLRLDIFRCIKVKYLPDSICLLDKLTTLSIRSCVSLVTLPFRFENLIALKYFALVDCTNFIEWPWSMRGLVSLEELVVDGCVWARDFPIGRLPMLASVDVSNCGELTNVPELVLFSPALKTFRLKDCTHLSFLSRFATPSLSSSSPALTEVTIIGSVLMKFIPPSVCDLVHLTNLTISKCGVTCLPDDINKLAALEVLCLHGCFALTRLPDSLCTLALLQSIDLSDCCILTELPSALGKLKMVTELKLDGCENICCLPFTLSMMSSLCTLSLRSCRQLTRLPADIGHLQNLDSLELYGCVSLTTLPLSISSLEPLLELNID